MTQGLGICIVTMHFMLLLNPLSALVLRTTFPKTYSVFLDIHTKLSFRYLIWNTGRVKVFMLKISTLKSVLCLLLNSGGT